MTYEKASAEIALRQMFESMGCHGYRQGWQGQLKCLCGIGSRLTAAYPAWAWLTAAQTGVEGHEPRPSSISLERAANSGASSRMAVRNRPASSAGDCCGGLVSMRLCAV